MTAPPGTQRHRFGIPRTKHRAGFTLIELLMVVVVIGLLARIGSQRYWGYLDRVKVAKAIGVFARAGRGQRLADRRDVREHHAGDA